jgi:acyl transferase domain-containing protein/acyl carrier protein
MTFNDHTALMKRALEEIQSLRAELARAKAAQQEPIAVIGMGCRFPGGADTPDAYWRLLENATDAVVEVPRSRWDVDAFYDPNPDAAGKMYTRFGGFLGDIDRFDAQFFGVSPLDAMNIDPQQRLLLEVAWEALENAGQVPGAVPRTGVYVGTFLDDYLQLDFAAAAPRQIDAYNTLGLLRGLAAGRLAYVLDLHGPAMQLDTACSSSLLAAHLAVQALRNGECDLALAGGVNLILVPEVTIGLCRLKAMAADGRCKTFDARADGYVRGEGCGVVVLKRLSDALADGDRIAAVIRGSAVNHDGKSNGITAPNGTAQKMVIRDALANAGIDASDVDFVEAHGTGTALGDPIEAIALGDTLCRGRSAPLLVGSVKSNFGHLESAAGAAALIKMALSLERGAIPASLHFEQPNPHIPWQQLPLRVVTATTPWPRGERRIAGISSFGMSGTNVHMIVERAPARVGAPALGRASGPYVLPISAPDDDALDALAERYATFLESTAESPRDICYTAARGRRHFDRRRAVAGESRAELAAALRQPRRSRGASQRPRIAFLFPGQGSQIVPRDEPVFREAFDQCDALARPLIGRPIVETVQLAIFAYEIALATLWRSWGIVPDAVAGHSVGEYAAATVAGVFTLEDAIRLLAERERLIDALPRRGAMAALMCDEARAAAIAPELSLAALNGTHVVVSGDDAAVHAAVERARAAGIDARPLRVVNAFHSSLMDPVLAPFEAEAARVPRRKPSITFVSTLTGEVAADELLDASYWRRHVREPVRFAAAVRRLAALGHHTLLEIGPRATLTAMARAVAGDATVLSSARPHQSLAALYEEGATIDWAAVAPRGAKVALPTYPFQRKRYWVPERPRAQSGGPRRLDLPFTNETRYEWPLDADWLRDHAAGETIVVPAAAYLAFAFEAGLTAIANVRFHRPLAFTASAPPTLHLVVDLSSFRFAARDAAGEWQLHCSGTIVRDVAELPAPQIGPTTPVAAANASAGFTLGASFRRTRDFRAGDAEVVCAIDAPEMHPGVIDSALRTLALGLPADGDVFAPVRIESLRLAATSAVTCHARTTGLSSMHIAGDVHLLDANGAVALAVRGLEARKLSIASITGAAALDDALLEIVWERASPTPSTTEPIVFRCEGSQEECIRGLLDLLHNVDGTDAHVVVVTKNAQPVLASDPIDPTHAWAWGLGRVVALEQPRLRWTTVDVDRELDRYDFAEREIAVRDGALYAPRIVKTTLAIATTEPLFRDDATYVVTGAFGALGARVARWMAGEGARHFILTGRSVPNEIPAIGDVIAMSVDVADRDAVARMLASAKTPIGGIIHAAGVLDDALLGDQTWERFERVFAAKVRGTMNLHEESRGLALDHFVCFSSAAALVGSRGQANYAAANSFMDALMHHRRRSGLPGLAINWGAWGGGGMAARMADAAHIDPDAAVALLGRIMRSGKTQIGVLPSKLAATQDAPRESFISLLDHTPAEERRERLARHIRERIVAVVGRDPFPADEPAPSFFELGLDSLMSLDLRNRLQADLDRALPSTIAFEYPTVDELADYLLR